MNEDGKIEGILHDFIILLFNIKVARPVYKMTESQEQILEGQT